MGGELAVQTTAALLLGMADYRESAVKGFDAAAKTATDKPAPRHQGHAGAAFSCLPAGCFSTCG